MVICFDCTMNHESHIFFDKMLNPEDESFAELFLCDADFPNDYQNMVHKEDYEVMEQFIPKYIYHKNGKHRRLLLRMGCVKILMLD